MARDEFELIYSQQYTDFMRGKAYSNPRYFSTPREGVTKVYVIGHWPNIVAAYKAKKVPVVVVNEDMTPMDEVLAAPDDSSLKQPAREPTHPDVEIPDDWRTLPWLGDRSLRALALALTDQPVINKAQAVAVVMAELGRRGADE